MLFTNGTLVTESIAARLAEAPPSCIEITLYGATEKTYEAVTGVTGSYARCCAGIEALVKHRIPLGLKSTLTRFNVGELEAMRQMAHNWGLPFFGNWLISKQRNSRQSTIADCRMSATECVKLESTDCASATEWTTAAQRIPNYKNSNFLCQAGKSFFVINTCGEIRTCLDIPLQFTSRPLDIGFYAAWKNVQNFFDSSPQLDSACLSCEIRSYCPRCPAWSFVETGTLTKPVPYLCEIARARKEHYGQSV